MNKNALHQLLTNVTYIGKLRYKTEIHEGEHAGIVDPTVFHHVQTTLKRNGRNGGVYVRNKHGALLKGLLFCAACGSAMQHTYSGGGKSGRRYRYYVCTKTQQRGRDACPDSSVPAHEIENLVVDQIRDVGANPAVLGATLAATRHQVDEERESLGTELAALRRYTARDEADLRRLATTEVADGASLARVADLEERVGAGERRMTEIQVRMGDLERERIDDAEATASLAGFKPVWDALTPREQIRVLQLLVQRVVLNGADGNLSITFHPNGIKLLAGEATRPQESAA